jgi:hypothetical protein
MKQGGSRMVLGYPVPVGVGDLVVYPGERSPGCPVHQGSGLPAQPEPAVFALVRLHRLWPGHYLQVRQPDPGRYLNVRVFLPGRRPYQGARQSSQAEPGTCAEPCQVRNSGVSPGSWLRIPAEGKQRPVDIEEKERAARRLGHGRTIALQCTFRSAAGSGPGRDGSCARPEHVREMGGSTVRGMSGKSVEFRSWFIYGGTDRPTWR